MKLQNFVLNDRKNLKTKNNSVLYICSYAIFTFINERRSKHRKKNSLFLSFFWNTLIPKHCLWSRCPREVWGKVSKSLTVASLSNVGSRVLFSRQSAKEPVTSYRLRRGGRGGRVWRILIVSQ